jgi:crotonobetainyl-CoA:carnitine CoA-transferase CaiB-like acyl-CoA transferase
MCHVLGLEGLVSDPRYAARGDRKSNEVELAAVLEETLQQETTEHWLEQLEAAGVPAGPLNNLHQMYSDPQVQARNMMVEFEDPELGTIKNIGIPVKLSATPGKIRRRAPGLGEHTLEILLQAGYTREQIEEMAAADIVKV